MYIYTLYISLAYKKTHVILYCICVFDMPTLNKTYLILSYGDILLINST